jgi:integrase
MLLRAWLPATGDGNDLIFPEDRGKVKAYEFLIRREFYPLLARLGIKNLTWHQLRDFFATTMVKAKTEKVQLKYWMGHEEFSTTEKYYVHHLPSDDDHTLFERAQNKVKISRPAASRDQNGLKYPVLVHST